MNDFIAKRDEKFWREITQIIEQEELDLNSFREPQRLHDASSLQPNLAYYELFKRIIEVPGSILEFGVYYGNGLFTWLNLWKHLSQPIGDENFGFDDLAGYNVTSQKQYDAVGYIKGIRGDFQLRKET